MPPIQKADPVARARALRFALVVLIVCFALLAWFLTNKDNLVNWLFANLDALVANSWIPWSFMLVVLSPVLVLGGWLVLTGRRVMQGKRFPPPGMAVTKDTEILTGEAAQRRARQYQVTGVVLVLCCVIAANLFRLIFLGLFA